MKSILIYGDSNVWGDGDISGRRIPMQCQWPNILRKNLGYEYLIYQEGLPVRPAIIIARDVGPQPFIAITSSPYIPYPHLVSY